VLVDIQNGICEACLNNVRGGKQCEADWSSFVLIAMLCSLQMFCAVIGLRYVMILIAGDTRSTPTVDSC
jgi:hypothetical protein